MRIINKLDASLTDNTRVIIYDRHMFIVQATELGLLLRRGRSKKSFITLTIGIDGNGKTENAEGRIGGRRLDQVEVARVAKLVRTRLRLDGVTRQEKQRRVKVSIL